MPSTILVRAAIFAGGAVIGGGIATALSRSRPTLTGSPPVGADTAKSSQPSSDLSVASNLSPVLKYGSPGPIADILVRKVYVAAYDRRLRHPAWTAQHLSRSAVDPSVDRTNSKFVEDDSLPLPFRARLQDYFRSGYDRGHMVPAADAKLSQDAMDETFFLSNIAPQVGVGFNRHYWAYLEDWCRRLTGKFQDVYVFTIPLYLPRQEADGKWRVTYEVIGLPPNISVPTHFAKVILTTKPTSPSSPQLLEITTGAFVLPNAAITNDTPLESFVMPVEAVERAAGLSLFSEQVKTGSKPICKSIKCDIIVRNFDDAQKRERKAIAAPK